MNENFDVTELEGELNADGLRVGIVVGRFNGHVTERLLDGALETLKRHGANGGDVDVARVPGSWEVPVATKWMATRGEHDALICLGAIIRGDTSHFEYIATGTSNGIAQVSLEFEIPVSFGVLTTETIEQAIDRAGLKQGNKGSEAAEAAIETANLLKEF